MKSGKCKTCGDESVYRRPAEMSGFFDMTVAHKTPLGKAGYALFADYICSRCGYTESYVEDEEALAKIVETWEKVPQ